MNVKLTKWRTKLWIHLKKQQENMQELNKMFL